MKYIFFDSDERKIINSITNNVNLSKLNRTKMVKTLHMILVVNENKDMKVFIKKVIDKFRYISEEDWEHLKKLLPLDCIEATEETMGADGATIDENGIVIYR